MTAREHRSVLLREAVDALRVRPDGVYVDGTFGRGGHARAILDALGPQGRLVALDRDPDAAAAAAGLSDPRFAFRRAWFSSLPDILGGLGVDRVDGVLLDLGVSSPQLDDPARGFSFRGDGPLDMRMDPARGESAADFLARASARELTEVLRDYGEERFAQSIARAIVAARALAPVVRTRQLAEIVGQALGARAWRDRSQDPATRTFQALRILVNRELEELAMTLPRALSALATGGRLAVIAFHSLEDRIVKRFFAMASQPFGGDPRLARLPIAQGELPGTPLAVIGKPVRPSAAEVDANPRARSAILRVGERTGDPLPAGLAIDASAARA